MKEGKPINNIFAVLTIAIAILTIFCFVTAGGLFLGMLYTQSIFMGIIFAGWGNSIAFFPLLAFVIKILEDKKDGKTRSR